MSRTISFTYTGLDAQSTLEEGHNIRLFQILPGRFEDPIQIYLKSYNQAMINGNYSAISYRWGSDDAIHEIMVNEKPFKVRKKLWEFLRHYQSAEDGRWSREKPDTYPPSSSAVESRILLWMDAICINQEDLNEKSSQVSHMGEIYRNAREVLVWLGGDPLELCNLYHHESHRRQFWSEEFEVEDDPGIVRTQLKKTPFSFGGPFMKTVATNQYWQRLWIIQELLLAKSTYIIVGNQKMNFKELLAWSWTDRSLIDPSCPFAQVRPILLDDDRLYMATMSNFERLRELLSSCIMAKCSNPLDKIYGVYHLSPELKDIVTVDYGITNEVLFAQLVQSLWRKCVESSDPKAFPHLLTTRGILQLLLDVLDISADGTLSASEADLHTFTERQFSITLPTDIVLDILQDGQLSLTRTYAPESSAWRPKANEYHWWRDEGSNTLCFLFEVRGNRFRFLASSAASGDVELLHWHLDGLEAHELAWLMNEAFVDYSIDHWSYVKSFEIVRSGPKLHVKLSVADLVLLVHNATRSRTTEHSSHPLEDMLVHMHADKATEWSKLCKEDWQTEADDFESDDFKAAGSEQKGDGLQSHTRKLEVLDRYR